MAFTYHYQLLRLIQELCAPSSKKYLVKNSCRFSAAAGERDCFGKTETLATSKTFSTQNKGGGISCQGQGGVAWVSPS